jgi:ABC-2 type transport system ATP-binding protein
MGDLSMELAPRLPETALAASGLTKTFKIKGREIKALDAVDIRLKTGTVTGLIGPDAAGKTTLMRLSAGLFSPTSGQIEVFGIDVAKDAISVQECIGYMPQRFGLYEDLTVQENLDLYADLHGVPVHLRKGRYNELMHMTGLAPFTRRLAGRLSGGMKQKLGLACTLIRSPQLLLLDEPTVGVDPLSRRELWIIINRLVREEGATVLLSTAYLDEAERCAEVILIHQGKILGQGRPEDFSGPMSGRTFRVTEPRTHKRALQERLSRLSEVVDAVIQGEGVRIVTRKAEETSTAALKSHLPEALVLAVRPRFEDGFIDLLRDINPISPQTEGPLVKGRAARVRDAVIVVENIKRRFGDFYAVEDVSFTVRRGEVFGLLGANGAGKSTTFRMLCGLLPASEGRLEVAGKDLRRAAAHARANIGYMAQKFSLYGDLSVMENLRFFSSAYGLSGSSRQTRISWALEEFELAPYSDAKSADLPLGYKQRLALAAAMMHEPEILFLDEPTSGVDPLARREFWRRINGLSQKGVTILVTTHFMEEAEYCDRLVIMAEGKILAQGSPEEIKRPFQSDTAPEPTLEEAFIRLIETRENQKGSQ